jgi:hypothetical protein
MRAKARLAFNVNSVFADPQPRPNLLTTLLLIDLIMQGMLFNIFDSNFVLIIGYWFVGQLSVPTGWNLHACMHNAKQCKAKQNHFPMLLPAYF